MKRVVDKKEDKTIGIEEIADSDIVLAKGDYGCYKLHRISERYALCACQDAVNTYAGSCGSIQEALRLVIFHHHGVVVVCDDVQEFADIITGKKKL